MTGELAILPRCRGSLELSLCLHLVLRVSISRLLNHKHLAPELIDFPNSG